jgi:hypothetical protein
MSSSSSKAADDELGEPRDDLSSDSEVPENLDGSVKSVED